MVLKVRWWGYEVGQELTDEQALKHLLQDTITQEVAMKVEVNEKFGLTLKEVFAGVTFLTKEGEELGVCMRDGGFEITIAGNKKFRIKDGMLESMEVTSLNESLQR